MTDPGGGLIGGVMGVQLGALMDTVRRVQAQHPELESAFNGAMQTLQDLNGAVGGRVPELKETASQAVQQQTQSAQTVAEKVGQTADAYKNAHDQAQQRDEENSAELIKPAEHLGGGVAMGVQDRVDQANQAVRRAQDELDEKTRGAAR